MSERATTFEESCEIADDFKNLQINQTPVDVSAENISEWYKNTSVTLNVNKCTVFNFRGFLATNINNQEQICWASKVHGDHRSKPIACNENCRWRRGKAMLALRIIKRNLIPNCSENTKVSLLPDTLCLPSATCHKLGTQPMANWKTWSTYNAQLQTRWFNKTNCKKTDSEKSYFYLSHTTWEGMICSTSSDLSTNVFKSIQATENWWNCQ